MYKFLLFLFFTSSSVLWSQEKLFYANDAFREGKHQKAADLYHEAFLKKQTYESAARLGTCYYYLKRYDQAELWLKKAMKLPHSQDTLAPIMAHVLRINGNYYDAKKQYQKLAAQSPEEAAIWSPYVESCEKQLNFESSIVQNEIFTLKDINDTLSDFPSSWAGRDVFFVSNRNEVDVEEIILDPSNDLPFYSAFTGRKSGSGYKDIVKLRIDNDRLAHVGPIFISNKQEVFVTINWITEENQDKEEFDLDLYVGKLNMMDFAITDLKPFAYNTAEFSEAHAFVSDDGRRLYFSSNRPQSYGGADIFMCEKLGKGWSEPVNVGAELNTKYDEFYPYEQSPDILFFSSNRPEGLGGLDIYAARFERPQWSQITLLHSPLNSSRDDFATVFTDEKSGYFASNRPGGQGSDDIYGFTLIAPLFEPLGPDTVLIVKIEEKFVEDEKLTYEEKLEDINKEKSLKIGDLQLKPNVSDTLYTLTGKVQQFVDSVKQPYDNSVVVLIIDTCGNQNKTRTNAAGEFKFDKVDDQNYTVRASKDDYFTSSMDVALTPPNEVEIIEERNILENIEYEFDSYALNVASRMQLDKVAAVMRVKSYYKINLESYTDERGPYAYNLSLSKKRADSVRKYLISKGVNSSRIVSNGYGENSPIVKNASTDAQHQLNRRTEFKWIIAK